MNDMLAETMTKEQLARLDLIAARLEGEEA